MNLSVVIFATLLIVTLIFFIVRGLFASSRFEQIAGRYPAISNGPTSYKYLQNGMINDLCFNGTLALSVTTDYLFIKTTFPIPSRRAAAIPLRDLKITEKRSHMRYTLIQIYDSEWLIGLESGWIEEIKEFQQGN